MISLALPFSLFVPHTHVTYFVIFSKILFLLRFPKEKIFLVFNNFSRLKTLFVKTKIKSILVLQKKLFNLWNTDAKIITNEPTSHTFPCLPLPYLALPCLTFDAKGYCWLNADLWIALVLLCKIKSFYHAWPVAYSQFTTNSFPYTRAHTLIAHIQQSKWRHQ